MSQRTTKKIPEIEGDISRVIEDAFFPTSPAATVREAIFSEILAGVMGASPTIGSLEQFYEAIEDEVPFNGESSFRTAVEVFEATYTTTGERGARGKRPKRYVIPFHPVIAESIRPEETRNWGKWYQVLMTTDDGSYNVALHDRFVNRLENQRPSNIFEEVFVEAAKSHVEIEDREKPRPIRPYVQACADVFQEDLAAWLEDDVDSPSNWLQSTRDLFCFHFMNYYIQLAVNLRREFDFVKDMLNEPFEPKMVDLPFGLWDETASGDRAFTDGWKELDGVGIERDVYDSWGRLAVINEIATTLSEESEYMDATPPTLSEAMQLPRPLQQSCVRSIENKFAEEERRYEVDLATAAHRLASAVSHDYSQRPRANQTPISMGINVVRQLGDGKERKYIRSQRGVGTTLRLNKSALRFFARLFTHAKDETHYDGFIAYLRQRGVNLDRTSQQVALQELEEMGMIHRLSDSGGAVYVRSI